MGVGTYSRLGTYELFLPLECALIRGWGLIRINTVFQLSEFWNTSLLFDLNYKFINGMRFSLSVSRACLVI